MINFKQLRNKENKIAGYLYTAPRFIMFFGARNCDGAFLTSTFSDLTFCAIKQTHSNTLVGASSSSKVADAHWTTQNRLGLMISTADCLPVLVYHPEFVCAIHAGWRGVKGEIIRSSLETLKNKFEANLDKALVAIGPFIHAENFEVDRALGAEFLKLYDSYFLESSGKRLDEKEREAVVLPHDQPDKKVYVDLLRVAQAQLLLCGVRPAHITDIDLNTFASNDFASFRRDRATGRNFSFVARRD